MIDRQKLLLTARTLPCLLLAAVFWFTGAGTVFGQSAVATDTGEILTLEQCVHIALKDNATLLVAAARADAAAKGVLRAKGAFLPSLSLSRTYNKSTRNDFDTEEMALGTMQIVDSGGDTFDYPTSVATGNLIDLETKSTYQDYSANVNFNVFSGFSKFSTLGAAQHDLEAARNTTLYNRELVVQYVATAYYNLLRYERLREVAVETRDQAARELERTETYFRLGSAAKSDVLQAKVRLEQTNLDLLIAENQVAQAFADLAYAMNRPLAERFQIDRSSLETDFELELVADLYAEALQKRLDLRAKEEELTARRKDITTASSSLLPRLDLFWRYSRYKNESPFRFGAQESDNTAYGYQVNWDIFDRLSTIAGRSQAKANARVAEYSLDQSRLDAQLEIRRLHNSLTQARESAALSRQTIESSKEELRLAQERFRVGAGTTLDRITAEVNLAVARADEVRAVCDFLINKVALERAVGRLSALTGDRQ